MSKLIDSMKDEIWGSVLLLIISAVSLVLSFAEVFPQSPVDPAWVAIVLCGAPILWDAATGLLLRHDIKADVLVAMAIVAAVYLNEWFAAGEVAFIMALGGLLEDISAAKASKGLEKLIDLTPRMATLVSQGEESRVPVEDVPVGSTLRVRPGESVPLDGVIIGGSTTIDESVLTGESVPVDKMVGDEVFSGTVNQAGAFDMRSTRANEDSSMQRMVELASSVDTGKTRMVRLADRWATYLVVTVMALAAITYMLTSDVYRAVTVMIVFCPCAFVLATPTAVVAAIGNLTRRGVLVRDGDSLERMSGVDTVAFDKTGTLTTGDIDVVGSTTVIDPGEFAMLVSSAESMSEHPFARAMVSRFSSGDTRVPEGFSAIVGRGIVSRVDGRDVCIGNISLMEDMGVGLPEDAMDHASGRSCEGCTTVFVSVDGGYAGTVSMSDTVRPGAAGMIDRLHGMGLDTVLLTGDNERSANRIVSATGVGRSYAGCLPEDKMSEIGRIQDGGRRVCMVGDGVNDAPSLRKAWVGIAMGEAGTDIAVESADMVLVGDRIESLPHIVEVSRSMVRKMNHNILFSLCWNLVAVALAMAAVLGPVEGAIVHNVGSVVVVVNSALLLMHGRRRKGIRV